MKLQIPSCGTNEQGKKPKGDDGPGIYRSTKTGNNYEYATPVLRTPNK